jgi:hypothetical protein
LRVLLQAATRINHDLAMTVGWRFIGEVWGVHKRPIVLECVIPIPDRKEAEAVAKQRLAGADQITAIELFQGEERVQPS